MSLYFAIVYPNLPVALLLGQTLPSKGFKQTSARADRQQYLHPASQESRRRAGIMAFRYGRHNKVLDFFFVSPCRLMSGHIGGAI
jgi:hypothetical protein